MTIPKFFNPHLLPQDYLPVSRSQLFENNDDSDTTRPHGSLEDFTALKDILDARFLGLANTPQPPKKRKRALSNSPNTNIEKDMVGVYSVSYKTNRH